MIFLVTGHQPSQILTLDSSVIAKQKRLCSSPSNILIFQTHVLRFGFSKTTRFWNAKRLSFRVARHPGRTRPLLYNHMLHLQHFYVVIATWRLYERDLGGDFQKESSESL